MESVVESGVTCCHHTCGNPLLDEFVSGIASVPGYSEQLDAATQAKTPETTEETQSSRSSSSHSTGNATVVSKESTSSNQTTQDSEVGYGMDSPESSSSSPEKSADSDYVEGYEMQRDPVEEESGGMSFSGSDVVGVLFVIVAVGGIYLGMRKKKM